MLGSAARAVVAVPRSSFPMAGSHRRVGAAASAGAMEFCQRRQAARGRAVLAIALQNNCPLLIQRNRMQTHTQYLSRKHDATRARYTETTARDR